jgi:vacuolar-type H+-ATPase subunit H
MAVMELLIDKIVSLESEANKIIEKARNDAKEMEKSVNTAIVAVQDELHKVLEKRVSDFRDEANLRQEKAIAEQSAETQRVLASVGSISNVVIAKQVDKIVNRFCES